MDNKNLLSEENYDLTRAEQFINKRSNVLGISRRRLVQLLAAGASVATVGLLPTRNKHKQVQAKTPSLIADNPDPRAIIKPAPESYFYKSGSNIEMRWENMYNRGYIVPNDLFFVRNNNPVPEIDLATWRLNISGDGVSKPQSFTYVQLPHLTSLKVGIESPKGVNGAC